MLMLLFVSTLVGAQQPAPSAPAGDSASNAGASSASPASDRILWDQLDPKYRRSKSERELATSKKPQTSDKAPVIDRKTLDVTDPNGKKTTIIIGPPIK